MNRARERATSQSSDTSGSEQEGGPSPPALAPTVTGRERFGFQLVQYSVQSTHLHLLVEGKDREAISRGMQGLLIRVAKALNRTWGRKGKVFADRYHDRILRTPREVKNAVRYVLENAQHHGMVFAGRPDPHSSGPWFDGWREQREPFEDASPPVAAARTWLLRTGWRRHGLLALNE